MTTSICGANASKVLNAQGEWVYNHRSVTFVFDRRAPLQGRHFAFWKIAQGQAVYRINEPWRSEISGIPYEIVVENYEWLIRFNSQNARDIYRDLFEYEDYLEIERKDYPEEWHKFDPWIAEQREHIYFSVDGSKATLIFPTKVLSTKFQIECL